ncbi:MFS transporter [Thalassobaculum fulvum]|uniref:MFS transporter n=1 Tax=Thalassobaculum fulvum TaxID=1633335 RepID=A0A918XR25_9PROT|nr:MFS transporter [Thalassobaculum fulvum]GHD46427.1 MFS transporter [Thalassobaculum fulvum]
MTALAPAIARGTVVGLGVSQLTCWGLSYYLIGVFGETIAADLGWRPSVVYGGFSAALVVMGLVSAPVGRLIDRAGGRPVMAAGSVLTAAGCLGLSAADGVAGYYAAWVVLGLAMRMTLYDAAFATLARIGGPAARRPIAQITLLGGLASTAFWPIGSALIAGLGWRGALAAYAGIALLTVPLHLTIPRDRHEFAAGPASAGEARTAAGRRRDWGVAALYAAVVTLTAFLNSAMSAHMIGLLSGLGLSAGAAVWIASVRGIGQSSARLGEVLFGRRLDPLVLNLIATGLIPVGLAVGLASGAWLAAALAFALLYGAGNGLATITRGTLPLVLFDPATYGTVVGRLLVPSFFLSALAPFAYAVVIERLGDAAALWLSVGVATATLVASLALWRIRRAQAS